MTLDVILQAVLRYILLVIFYFFLFALILSITREIKRKGRDRAGTARKPLYSERKTGAFLIPDNYFLTKGRGDRYFLDEHTSIGNHPDNDIIIKSPYASARHAVIIFDGNKYILKDLGSSKSTFVNGSMVKTEKVLTDGDRLKIAGVTLRFVR